MILAETIGTTGLTGLEQAGIIGGFFFSSASILLAIYFGTRVQNNRITNKTLRVEVAKELHDIFAAKDEFAKHVEDTQRGFENVERRRREDSSLLHEKINKVDRDVAGLSRATELQNQFLSRIDAKLDRAIEHHHE